MLPPDALNGIADTLLELYSELDEVIIRDITRRLMKTGTATAATAHQLRRAQEAGLLFDDIIAKVAAMTNASDAHVRAIFEDAGLQAMEFDKAIYEAAGMHPPHIRMSAASLQLLRAGFRKTNGQLRNLTMTTALEAQQVYIRAAAAAEMMVESGAFDYATAIRRQVEQAATDGTFVQYPSGRRDRLDVAVRRAVLTGINQTCANISLQNAADMGCDLVETTAHHGARPEHMVWQGRVFSISGKHPGYAKLDAATGYGTGTGLCGWNCRHSFYPFFEGLSSSAYPHEKLREYENKTVSYKGEEIPYYDATQQQRSYERDIRATRRELVAFDEMGKAGDTAAQGKFNAASVKLKRQEAKLRDFVRETGLQKDASRTQVRGFGRSASGKAVWANKKSEYVVERIGRSVGAKAKNHEVLNPKTGTVTKLVEGTRITQRKDHVIAGKGRERKIDEIDFLVDNYGGSALEWTKEKGFGYVLDEYGEARKVELHWYQEPSIGKVKMKIKLQSGGGIYIDED